MNCSVIRGVVESSCFRSVSKQYTGQKQPSPSMRLYSSMSLVQPGTTAGYFSEGQGTFYTLGATGGGSTEFFGGFRQSFERSTCCLFHPSSGAPPHAGSLFGLSSKRRLAVVVSLLCPPLATYFELSIEFRDIAFLMNTDPPRYIWNKRTSQQVMVQLLGTRYTSKASVSWKKH